MLVRPLPQHGPAPHFARQSYAYRFLKQSRGGDIICWDSTPHRPEHSVLVRLNRERRNVLYANGRVGTVSEEQFKSLRLRGVSLTLSRQ